jgi:two-component system cell cycle sensor histidine kinase/response regulator CckA
MTSKAQSTNSIRILHLEDDENDHLLVREMLEAEGFQCEFALAKDRHEFELALSKGPYDVIISDFSLPAYDGLRALGMAQNVQRHVPFIFFSGTIGEETAVDSLKTGATDYVVKQRPHRLAAAIRRALEQAQERARRERAEERIHEQAALLDKAGDAIIVLGLNENIIYWNKGAERIYGWTANEATESGERLLNNEDARVSALAKKQVLERGEWMGQCFQATKDGRRIITNSRWTLLRDNSGNPKAHLVINTDITDIKNMEAQLLRAQRLESIGALAGGIAHDLNNILAPILMASDLLGVKLQDQESKTMLETVHSCARRGSEMVKQILSFARGVSGDAAIIHLKPLITEMASLAKDTFPRSLKIETSIDRDLHPIVGNTTQMHQVLMNLCVNARDAMPEGGTLRLELRPENVVAKSTAPGPQPEPGRYTVLSVIDTGHGMPPDILGRIFDPFFTTKAEGKGTGLGLATVKEIIKNHRGVLQVFSEPGKGTTFKVYLPATPLSESQKADSTSSGTPAGNGELILVVDDELAISEMIRGTLQSFNYRVLSAKNGAEAVLLFQKHQSEIRAVVMDMMMPVMDGPNAVRSIQKLSPTVRIIGISGLESQSTLTDARDLVLDAFLRKPFTVDNLLMTVNRVLKEKVT